VDIIISTLIAFGSLVLAIFFILIARWDANKVIDKLYREEYKERNRIDANVVKSLVGNLKQKRDDEISSSEYTK